MVLYKAAPSGHTLVMHECWELHYSIRALLDRLGPGKALTYAAAQIRHHDRHGEREAADGWRGLRDALEAHAEAAGPI